MCAESMFTISFPPVCRLVAGRSYASGARNLQTPLCSRLQCAHRRLNFRDNMNWICLNCLVPRSAKMRKTPLQRKCTRILMWSALQTVKQNRYHLPVIVPSLRSFEGMDDSHSGHFRSTRRHNTQPEADSHNRIFGDESDMSRLRSRRGSTRTQHVSSIKLGSSMEERKLGLPAKTESSRYGAGGNTSVPEPYINIRQTRRPDGNPLTGEGYSATVAVELLSDGVV